MRSVIFMVFLYLALLAQPSVAQTVLVETEWVQTNEAHVTETQANTAQIKLVVTSIEPLAMLVRQVFADQVRVETLLLPGQTPHFAAFTPGQAQRLQQADVIVWLGAQAEPNLRALIGKADGKTLALLDVEGVTRYFGEAHQHESDHQHHANELDPHLWLSPENMRLLSEALLQLAEPLGLKRADVEQRINHFAGELSEVVAAQRGQLQPLVDRHWLSQHNPWGYFVEALGLQAPATISSGLQSSISSRRFTELMQLMQENKIDCALAEPEARRALLQRLCTDACVIVDADPLGRDLEKASYTEFVQHLGQTFRQCLTGPLKVDE